MHNEPKTFFGPIQRIRFWYALLLLLGAVFIVRLFYLQVIRHDYYAKTAAFSQLKQYEIPAARGVIKAKSGEQTVPLVLNETKYTLFVDPKYVKDARADAEAISKAIGGASADYQKKIENPDSPRYTILAKRLSNEQHEAVEKLALKGVGTREAQYRTYPDAQLAAQVLGFVNDDNEGKYGLEQALNDELKGTPGQLKAITDAAGVPLAANKDNVVTAPQSGSTLTLTIDIGVQQQLEDILKQGVEKARGESGSALILDANTGAVRAMASYPTYSPSEYYKVENGAAFNNMSVSSPIEIGSVMKPLTAAAAINLGVVNPNTSYYDPSFYKIDGATVSNIEEDGGAAQRTVTDIVKYSLNTGASWLLMQMGGGTINEQARTRWYDYMTNHYGFGKQTGVEQGFEAEGQVPHPTDGYGLNITYANSAFGQGMTATPLQLGAAFNAIVNGGTYYKPFLVESKTDDAGKEVKTQPQKVRTDVVSPEASAQMIPILEATYEHNKRVFGVNSPAHDEYSIGGKTGTAQISNPQGGYYEDQFNGMYVGFVGGDKPEYIIVTRVDKPKIAGYAGSKAAAPIFVSLANMLIDSYGVTPKTQ